MLILTDIGDKYGSDVGRTTYTLTLYIIPTRYEKCKVNLLKQGFSKLKQLDTLHNA